MRAMLNLFKQKGVRFAEGFVSPRFGEARFFRANGAEVALPEDEYEVSWAKGLLLQMLSKAGQGFLTFRADLVAGLAEVNTAFGRRKVLLEDLAKAVAPERFKGWFFAALFAEEPQPLVDFHSDGLVLSFIGTTEMRAPRALESYFLPLSPEVLEEARQEEVRVDLEDDELILLLGKRVLTLPLERLTLL